MVLSRPPEPRLEVLVRVHVFIILVVDLGSVTN
jgi:hypothetical protein